MSLLVQDFYHQLHDVHLFRLQQVRPPGRGALEAPKGWHVVWSESMAQNLYPESQRPIIRPTLSESWTTLRCSVVFFWASWLSRYSWGLFGTRRLSEVSSTMLNSLQFPWRVGCSDSEQPLLETLLPKIHNYSRSNKIGT